MLQNAKVFASFSVNDIARAKEFYGDMLGLEVKETKEGLELHFAGGSHAFVYAKPDHVPATYTVLNFMVPDIDHVVDELAAKDVQFEHYDQEHMKTDEKGISRGVGDYPSIAWFRDPFGNFLSVIEEK